MNPDNRDHLRALLAAYVEITGLEVTLSFPRRTTLREFDRRGFTPADVMSVLGRIKKLMAAGAKGYSDVSLDWRNCMANVDTFEEHLLKIRQARGRAAGAKREATAAAPRAQTARLPGGGTMSVLASVPTPERIAPIKGALTKLIHEQLRKGQQ